MKRGMGPLGIGMVMGASLMGAYMHFMPMMKKNSKQKKMASPYTASLMNVKTSN